MEENQNKNLLKKLLDRLQEDSWQLELLVSGFTIFGLFYALVPVKEAFGTAVNNGDIFKDIYQIVYISILILIFNLIVHVILRSIWIGALGLRYISGEVEIDNLNYGERFTNYLHKKVSSFDDYIEKLEKLCSIIFAISFLLIFYVAAIFLFQILINIIGSLDPNNESIILRVFQYSILILLAIGAVLTFFDYLTQGLLKKNKWVASVYFPFYWVFSYLSLSFLYRPLYYNLIDNKFGRRISFLLVPIYILILFISSMYKEQSGFISLGDLSSSAIIANSQNYQDLVEKNDLFISAIAIQSKLITDPFIKIKIPLSNAIEDNILEFNERLKASKDKHLYKSHIDLNGKSIESSFKGNTDSLHLEFMKTFQNIYTIQIDSIPCKLDFVITNEKDRLCLESYIGTNSLSEGKHILLYSRFKHPATDSIITIREIPFWYYKD